MADGCRSRPTSEGQIAHLTSMGSPRQGESLCTLGHEAPSLALPADRLRCGPSGITRANIQLAIRAPCGKDGSMKRAARRKTGSVVFDKRRKTWNFLWWEDGKRRSKSIGTASQYRTKSSAWDAAQVIRNSPHKQINVGSSGPTVNTLVQLYRVEKMPRRIDTRRSYEVWLKNY